MFLITHSHDYRSVAPTNTLLLVTRIEPDTRTVHPLNRLLSLPSTIATTT